MYYFIFGMAIVSAFKLVDLSDSENKLVIYSLFVLSFIVSFIVIGLFTILFLGEV
jgi:hypothetical protein